MSSRFSAARPKRAGEAFARQHHGEDEGDDNGSRPAAASKKVTFDVRNPSALAPDAREEDDILDADVIGAAAGATKRGAVNIDGYDSDSENETFNVRAEQRKKPVRKLGKTGGGAGDDGEDVNLIDQLDNYDKRLKGEAKDEEEEEEDNDDDMFGGGEDEDEDGDGTGKVSGNKKTAGRKTWKEVRFLGDRNIEGQERTSRRRGQIRIDDDGDDAKKHGKMKAAAASDDEDGDGGGSSTDSEDEERIALEIQEEAVDDEVGAGGLKKHAPKIDAFNMRQEQEEGAFDEAGNFIRKAVDPDAQHDRWLEGLSRKEMRRAAAAHEAREAALRATRRADDSVLTADLLATLLARLARGETPLEALARLGRARSAAQAKAAKAKRVPLWRQRQMERKAGGSKDKENETEKDKDGAKMDVDKADDPEQARVKQDIDAITEAADHLLGRDYPDIYEAERERLMREYRAETGEAWVDPPRPDDDAAASDDAHATWEYRWMDGRDGGAVQGPYDGPTMKAWKDAGYFEGVEFRRAGSEGGWRQDVAFA